MEPIVGEYYGPPPRVYAMAQAVINSIMSTPPERPLRTADDWYMHRACVERAAAPWFRLMADIPWPPPAIVWKGDLAFILPRAREHFAYRVGRLALQELDA
jgi:hypothetical protein